MSLPEPSRDEATVTLMDSFSFPMIDYKLGGAWFFSRRIRGYEIPIGFVIRRCSFLELLFFRRTWKGADRCLSFGNDTCDFVKVAGADKSLVLHCAVPEFIS